MSDEQRREKRIPTRQRLWCEGQAAPNSIETRDVSRNGMFIVAENAPEIGSQMTVTLEDDGAKVTLQREVVWRGSKTEGSAVGRCREYERNSCDCPGTTNPGEHPR